MLRKQKEEKEKKQEGDTEEPKKTEEGKTDETETVKKGEEDSKMDDGKEGINHGLDQTRKKQMCAKICTGRFVQCLIALVGIH